MQEELGGALMWVDIKVVDALGVEGRCTPFDAVHDVSLRDEELRKVAAILSGDARNESGFS
jgi:hypothetical protein